MRELKADVPASAVGGVVNPMRELRQRLGMNGRMLSLKDTALAMGVSTGAVNTLDQGIAQAISPMMRDALRLLHVDPDEFEREYLAYAEAERAAARRKVLGR